MTAEKAHPADRQETELKVGLKKVLLFHVHAVGGGPFSSLVFKPTYGISEIEIYSWLYSVLRSSGDQSEKRLWPTVEVASGSELNSVIHASSL